MGFFEEHAQAVAVTRSAELVLERLPQNAPQRCATCDAFGTDVLLGVCAACAKESS